MPITIKVDAGSTCMQAVVLPAASAIRDGMMTALMVKKLNALWVAGGQPDPAAVGTQAEVAFATNATHQQGAIVHDATAKNDGVITKSKVQRLNALWVAGGLPLPTAPSKPVTVRFQPNCTTLQAVVPRATPFNDGAMTADMVQKLSMLAGSRAGSTASIVDPVGSFPKPPLGLHYVQLDGVDGFSDADLSSIVSITGAAHFGLNTVYEIFQVNDPTSIVLLANVSGAQTSLPDANNGAISWSIGMPTTNDRGSLELSTGAFPPPGPGNSYVEVNGIFGADVQTTITLSGASQVGFNGAFSIFQVNSPNSIVMLGNFGAAAAPDAHNGALTWLLS